MSPSSSPVSPEARFTVFSGFERIAAGTHGDVMAALRARPGDLRPLLVFDDQTGEQIDLDLRPAAAAVPAAPQALPAAPECGARRVGRPRLGVVAREVTLLPRHWEWLGRQPGGASAALRRLVDEARRVHADRDAVRASREAAYRFMTAIGGNLPGFEEAARALFAGDLAHFDTLTAPWPGDVRTHLHRLAASAWSAA